jgi:hypothetical protein
VYREMGVPMTPRESGAVEATDRHETMSTNTTEQKARSMAEANLDRIADKLLTAERGDLEATVEECRAELEVLETMLEEA